MGKVGANYLVSARLVDAQRAKVLARSSIQVNDANLLLNAVWQMAQQILDSYGNSLAGADADKFKNRSRTPPASAMVAEKKEEEEPSQLGVSLQAVGGYQPLSDPGKRGSVGGELMLGWRIRRVDLGIGAVIAPQPGARVSFSFALLDSVGRLSVGLRATAFPGAQAFGGGPAVTYEFPLGDTFAVLGSGAAEIYPSSAAPVVAVLGGAGVAAHF